MRYRVLPVVLFPLFPLFLLGTASGSALAEEVEPPAGAVQAGTLANQQLVRDALVGVAGKVAALGCEQAESFTPYVKSRPAGDVGSRVWKEVWIVAGCDASYRVDITFSEAGPHAANWTID